MIVASAGGGIALLAIIVVTLMMVFSRGRGRTSAQPSSPTASPLISTTDLQSTARRADELDKERKAAIAQAKAQNPFNDIAIREATDRAATTSKDKIDREFSKLINETVQWHCTVERVSVASVAWGQGNGEIVLKQLGSTLSLHIVRQQLGQAGSVPWTLAVGYDLSDAVAKQLRPGDRLLIKGRVQSVKVEPKQVLFGSSEDISIQIWLAEAKAERAKDVPGDQLVRPKTEQQKQAEGEAAACAGCGGCTACGTFGCVAIPLAVIALIVLNIAILVWVARDAKSRGMDSAVVWMILVMFTSLIGLLIYIFSRPQGNLVRCRDCGNKRLQASAQCPHCKNP